MTFHLVDSDSGLYLSDKTYTREPVFSPSYFSQNDFGWYKSEVSDNYYKYDRQLQRVLCQKFDRNLPKKITDEDYIQFSRKKTIF